MRKRHTLEDGDFSEKMEERTPSEPSPAAQVAKNWLPAAAVAAAIGAALLGYFGNVAFQNLNPREAPHRIGVPLSRPLPAEETRPSPPPVPQAPASSLPPADMTAADLVRECQEVAVEVSERYPNTPYALVILAQSLAIQGKHVEAMNAWEKCLEADPNLADGYAGMIELAARDGDFAKAVEIGRRALAATATPAVRNILGHALLQVDKPEEAVRVLEENLKRNDPRSPPALYLLGKAHSRLGNWELARKYYAAAIEANPDYVHAYYGLFNVCARLGRKEESQRYLADFKRLQRRNEDNLVRLRTARDELEEDRYRAEAAITVGLLAPLHVSAARVYYNLRDTRKAEEHWRRAAAMAPGDLESRASLVMLQRQEGRIDDAIRTLQEMVAIEPRTRLTT